MGLKELYFKLEDKYYAFIDWLDSKGISLYPIIDAIESKNIPSFPFMVLIAVIIIALLGWLLLGIIAPTATITFLVTDAEDDSPIAEAVVIASFAEQSVSAVTKDDGKAVLVIPVGSEVSVSITKEGYEEGSLTFIVEEAMEKAVALAKEIEMLSKTIQLMNSATHELLQKPVTISFSCSNPESDFSETKTSSTGIIELGVPSNCGNLLASPVAGFTLEDGVIALDDAVPQLFLQEEETETGTVAVYVKDKAGKSVAGVTVRLVRSDGVEQQIGYSSTAGSALFEDVPTGSYYVIVHDRQGRYADYDSSLQGEVKSLAKDGTVEFQVVLSETVAGTIKVLVKDSQTNQPVENAEVKLKKSGTVRDSQYTDSDGRVEFNVQDNVAFDLEINHPNYLIATLSNVTPKETFNEIFLEPATSSNSQTLVVEVKDSRGSPIDGVKLVLKKSDGTIVGDSKVTGFDGKAEFPNLALETFYVYAIKKGFEGKNSNPITIQARQENKIVMVLNIGFGDIEVKVLDDKGGTVQGALVELHNIVSEEKEGEGITGLEGTALFNVRADKKVFFRIDADEFIPYNTSALSPDPGAKLTKEVELVKDATKLEVELLGLFLDGEKTFGRTVAAGQTYTAKLLLLIPKGSRFNAAGIHLRTGNSEEDRINSMEEDDLHIKDVVASTLGIKKGTSYYPPKGYAEDSKHLTVGDSKWVSVEWKNVTQGVYELEAEIQVKENVALGELLKIFYRAWGKTGAYIRFPADAELGSQEATANKQALYANAKLETFTAGPTNLCDAFFCKSFTVEDLGNKTQMRVVNEYPATIGNTYKLRFSINSIGEKPLPNSEIEFGSESDGLLFTNYQIVDVLGSSSSGVAEGYTLGKGIGNIQKGSVVSGFIEFFTEKEGSNKLTILIKSNKTPVFEEAIDVKVEAAEQLQLDVLPKEIVPTIDNLLLVRVSNGEGDAVSNAIVTIWLDDTVVFSSQTNADGEVSYEMEAPAPGQALKIAAEKNGYKDIETEITIDDSILLVTPPEISEKLVPALFEKEVGLLLSNLTAVELEIADIEISSDFKDMVEFSFDEDYVGRALPVNSDENMFITIRLTEAGFFIEEPTTLQGAISFYTKVSGIERTFVTNVALEIRIGLGGEVDDPNCLSITPREWEIITSSDSAKVIELELKNSCAVDGIEIPLRNLQVKLHPKEDNLLGEFVVSSDDIPNADAVEIEEDFELVAEQLPAGFEGSIEIEFIPKRDVESAEAEYEIEFMAVNVTENGEEEIETRLKTAVFLSDLVECVEVTAPEPITIYTSPWNLGYGQYGGFGYSPYGSGGYGSYGYYGGSTGYLQGGGYLGGGTYPYSNFDAPYYSRYFNTSDEVLWQYGLGQDSFRVENTCTIPVEIDLEVDSLLRTSESKFSLEPQEASDIRVEASYRMGKYNIDVRARVEGSNDKFVKVETLDVLVRRPDEIDEDCIKLSPTKISLNNFLGKPVPAKIYNYCYDAGVLLEKTDRVITFKCQVPGQPTGTFGFAAKALQKIELQGGYIPSGPGWAGASETYSPNESYLQTGPYGSGFYNYPYATQEQGMYYPQQQYPYGSSGWGYAASGYEGDCPLIEGIYIVGESKTGGEEGKTIQVVEYEVKPSIQYRQQLCQYHGQLPFQTAFGLRLSASAAYYRSAVRATAEVLYRTTFGGADSAYFRVMLEDLWGIGETIDECMNQAALGIVPREEYLEKITKGNCRLSDPNACINKQALNFVLKYQASKGFVPQGFFSGNMAVLKPSIKVLKIAPNLCGWHDKIKNVRISQSEKNGVRLGATVVNDGHNIAITVDRSNMEYRCVKIDTTVTAELERPRCWAGARSFSLPLKINILYKDFDVGFEDIEGCETRRAEEEPPAKKIISCPEGKSGEEIYTKYGFNKLLFNWNKQLHKDGYLCDEQEDDGTAAINRFCDAVHFSLELSEKGNKIKGKIDEWKVGKFASDDIVKAATGQDDVDDLKNTANLFRWAKKQIKVKDKIGDEELVFFLKGDNEILESENTESIVEKLGNVEALTEDEVSEGNMDAIVQHTNEALNSITAEVDQKRIIAVIKSEFATKDKYAEQIALIGIDKPSGTTFGNHVMTFKEYRELHRKLWDALKANSDTDACYTKDDKSAYSKIIEDDEGLRKQAQVCVIGETDITKAFLVDLANSIEKFVVGVLHTEDAEIDGVDFIIEKAADVEGLGENLKDWYYKNVEFSAFLIKDGYSEGLRKDFANKYSDVAAVKAVDYAEWTGGGTLDSAGKFAVLINYKWAEDKFELVLDKEKTLAELSPDYAKNPFFELPFDGEVKSADGKREGYGVGFNNPGRDSLLITDKGDKDGKAVPFYKLQATDSLKEITLLSSRKVLKSNIKGAVLVISDNVFAFNPLVPVVISAQLDEVSAREGMLYDLDLGAKEPTESTAGFDSLIQWSFGADSRISRIRAQNEMRCRNVNQDYFGFIRDGKQSITGLIFLPFDRQFSLNVWCVQGQAKLTTKMKDTLIREGVTIEPAVGRARDVQLNDTSKDKDKYTLEKLIEEINTRKGNMCVIGDGKKFALQWRTDAFLK